MSRLIIILVTQHFTPRVSDPFTAMSGKTIDVFEKPSDQESVAHNESTAFGDLTSSSEALTESFNEKDQVPLATHSQMPIITNEITLQPCTSGHVKQTVDTRRGRGQLQLSELRLGKGGRSLGYTPPATMT